MDITHSFYKKYISTNIISLLLKTKITPNHITVFNLLFTLILGCYFFSRGTYIGNILALGVMLINVFLDYLDGDYARSANKTSLCNAWLDVKGDLVLRYAIMAAISFGVRGFSPSPMQAAILLLFVSLGASNMLAFEYNNTFGFDSYRGNLIFRKNMDKKPNIINIFFKNIIDPTENWIALSLFTVRYWIILGAIFNVMRYTIFVMTFFITIQWIIMFILYTMHLSGIKKLWVLQVLASMDKERQEHYALCSSKAI